MAGREPGNGPKWPKVFSERVKVFYSGFWAFCGFGPKWQKFFLRGFFGPGKSFSPGSDCNMTPRAISEGGPPYIGTVRTRRKTFVGALEWSDSGKFFSERVKVFYSGFLAI